MVRKHSIGLVAVLGAALSAGRAGALTQADVEAAVAKRLTGDRTGVCVAVAVIGETTQKAFGCADPASPRRPDERTAFEIGSVTKTMTAALLAREIERGALALDAPLASLLPEGTRVPSRGGREILLRHVVTHSSGLPALPSRMQGADPGDPYAKLTPEALLASLGEAELSAAPGERWEYSNFAMMALSLGLSRREGKSFEALLSERLFAPLGMSDSYVSKPRPALRVAAGHQSNGKETPPWTFHADLAGVGGVRSTLADMVRYVEAQLGRRKSPLDAALARTQKELPGVPERRMGMSWLLAPLSGRTVHLHEGGTGGFSSLVAFDLERRTGVVVLADTALSSLGGLGDLGLHLLDAAVPLGTPRKEAAPDAKLLEAVAGRYRLGGVLKMEVRRKGGGLEIQAAGQPAFEMGYDSAGDFYPKAFDALLRPKRQADGRYVFTWHQGGGVQEAVREDGAARAPFPKPPAEALRAYEGSYPLAPGFSLRVFVQGSALFVQGTGQPPIEVAAVEKDVFVAESVGAEIAFERGPTGAVASLVLKQGGQNLRGEKR